MSLPLSIKELPVNFQSQLIVQEWMLSEFERFLLHKEGLINHLENIQFIGVNGLIQRQSQTISPFLYFVQTIKNEKSLHIFFSVPVIKTFDTVSLSFLMEFLTSLSYHVLCKDKNVDEAEKIAFEELKYVNPVLVGSSERNPQEELSARIEIQLITRTRVGTPIITERILIDSLKSGAIFTPKPDCLRAAKKGLALAKSELKNYSRVLGKKYRVTCLPFLFRTTAESLLEPTIIPVFGLQVISQTRELFSVLVISSAIVERVTTDELAIVIAFESIYDQMREKFSRGEIEREIFQIISGGSPDKLKSFVKKEIGKFYDEKLIDKTLQRIQEIVKELIAANYPIINIDQ